ncbi:hypothetical protein MOF23_07470 [Bacillus inaquosorum]|uniref:hypothetical protein n=1 Tax=Bacillus inaquosorum TaxID=483913 RepID=UPI002282EAA2|nr:hypothetical protein [Bacillus inaquosorum]MCY9308807.1 hypothetical protein [Bacillus inaquosorum]
MYIDKIFEEIKNKMAEELAAVKSLTDFKNYCEWAEQHHKLINQLCEIQSLHKSKDVNEPQRITVDEDLKGDCPAETIANTDEDYPVGNIFKISKKAFGGLIDELNYPIPEELMRVLQLENGNKIKIVGTNGFFPNNTPKYEFEIVDRTNIPNPDLMEIRQGIVKDVGRRLVITETVSGLIKIKEMPVALYVNEKDAARFNIKDGDIVDGRFYSNNIVNSFRTTYKYDTDETEKEESVESKRLSYRQTNQSEQIETGFSMIDRLDKSPFLEKTILLIGLRSRINDFKSSLEKTNEINLVHLSGDEHQARIRAQILKADFVLLSTYENGHDKSKFAASLCNEFGIPFTSTKADGLFGVLQDAKELIGKKKADCIS